MKACIIQPPYSRNVSDCDVDCGINILNELEKNGKADISYLFKD